MARLGHVRLVALELQAQAQAQARHVRQQMTTAQVLDAVVRATPQVGNNNKSKTRAKRAEPQNKTFISLRSSSRPRSLLSSISGASSHLPSPSSIVVKDPTSGETYFYNNASG